MTNETYNMLEEGVQDLLEQMKTLNISTKEGKETLAKATTMVTLLTEVDRTDAEVHDKEERRRIEEEKNKAANETEREKQKLTWGRAIFEMAKVTVPTVVTAIFFGKYQKRMFKFEETGFIKSTGGREMHLPRLWK